MKNELIDGKTVNPSRHKTVSTVETLRDINISDYISGNYIFHGNAEDTPLSHVVCVWELNNPDSPVILYPIDKDTDYFTEEDKKEIYEKICIDYSEFASIPLVDYDHPGFGIHITAFEFWRYSNSDYMYKYLKQREDK